MKDNKELLDYRKALEDIMDAELHPFLESERLGLGKTFPDSKTFKIAQEVLNKYRRD